MTLRARRTSPPPGRGAARPARDPAGGSSRAASRGRSSAAGARGPPRRGAPPPAWRPSRRARGHSPTRSLGPDARRPALARVGPAATHCRRTARSRRSHGESLSGLGWPRGARAATRREPLALHGAGPRGCRGSSRAIAAGPRRQRGRRAHRNPRHRPPDPPARARTPLGSAGQRARRCGAARLGARPGLRPSSSPRPPGRPPSPRRASGACSSSWSRSPSPRVARTQTCRSPRRRSAHRTASAARRSGRGRGLRACGPPARRPRGA